MVGFLSAHNIARVCWPNRGKESSHIKLKIKALGRNAISTSLNLSPDLKKNFLWVQLALSSPWPILNMFYLSFHNFAQAYFTMTLVRGHSFPNTDTCIYTISFIPLSALSRVMYRDHFFSHRGQSCPENIWERTNHSSGGWCKTAPMTS